jgi:hypothetical protein
MPTRARAPKKAHSIGSANRVVAGAANVDLEVGKEEVDSRNLVLGA